MITRKRIWEVVELAAPHDRAGRRFGALMLLLIFLNVLAVVFGSVQSVYARWGGALDRFEVFSVAVFSLEYLLRLWACREDPRFAAPLTGRVRFILTPMAIVDAMAILPFFLPFLGFDLRSIRALRLLRLLRVAKIGHYYKTLGLIRSVVRAKREELILTSALMLILLVVSASILFACENAAQPEVFSSIPATMWWSVATLTTVGYGDMYPVTVAGKICAGIIAILGIGMFALPAGILGSGFVEAVQKSKPKHHTCPHCGGSFDATHSGDEK
ncbi:MAG: ion transporter [Kiritimatiellia bacterium]